MIPLITFVLGYLLGCFVKRRRRVKKTERNLERVERSFGEKETLHMSINDRDKDG